jgi:hypothetical protein
VVAEIVLTVHCFDALEVESSILLQVVQLTDSEISYATYKLLPPKAEFSREDLYLAPKRDHLLDHKHIVVLLGA